MLTGLQSYFGRHHGFTEMVKLERIARLGVPVDVGPGGNLDQVVEVWEQF